MTALATIVLHLDLTPESQRALQRAIHLSLLSGATIIAVNVVNRHVVTQLARTGAKSLAEIEIELEENGWRYLYAAEEEAKNAGARIVVLQETGYPEEVIPRIAAEKHADLVIVAYGQRARSDITAIRSAEQIFEHAPCDVLVVK
ncbi:MAG: universal stress protein [bacterium]|nr:universal stress protein [bacterium]